MTAASFCLAQIDGQHPALAAASGRAFAFGLCQLPFGAIRASGLFRPPGAAFVRANAMMMREHRIDHHPSGFNRVFACEQRRRLPPSHRPIGARMASPRRACCSSMLKLFLLTDEFLARKLHARGDSHSRIRRKPKRM